MAAQRLSYTRFVQELSTMIAGRGTVAEAARGSADLLRGHLGEVGVRIELRGAGLTPVVEERAMGGRARFVYSKKVTVRGVDYGRLTVEVETPGGSPGEWMMAMDVMGEQLGLRAERAVLKREARRLEGEKRVAGEELETMKLVARAAGVVAGVGGVSVEVVRAWMGEEAERRGRTVRELAEQLLLQRQVFEPEVGRRARKAAA